MLNAAHLHIAINHFPIILMVAGLVTVLLARLRQDDHLARYAFWTFVAAAGTGLVTYLTGLGAEDVVRDIPTVSREIIERHQAAATVTLIAVGTLGAFAAWALWKHRRPAALPAGTVTAALVWALIGAAAGAYTGLLGGEIRHTEARAGFVAPPAHASVDAEPREAGDSARR